jgi:hypothetical protein
MPIGRDRDQLSFLPSQALYLCLQDLVDSMQQEIDMEAAEHPTLPINTEVTELWRKKDIDAFVEALHSIRAKAPNGGFKASHFREVSQVLAEKVPDGVLKTADQLSSKYAEVRCILYDENRSGSQAELTYRRLRLNTWPLLNGRVDQASEVF